MFLSVTVWSGLDDAASYANFTSAVIFIRAVAHQWRSRLRLPRLLTILRFSALRLDSRPRGRFCSRSLRREPLRSPLSVFSRSSRLLLSISGQTSPIILADRVIHSHLFSREKNYFERKQYIKYSFRDKLKGKF